MTPSALTEIGDAIATADKRFMDALGKGDAAGLTALYAENAQLLPTNSDFVTGKEAIQAFWQAGIDMGIKGAKLETIEVEGHGDTAYEVGKYTILGEGKAVIDAGKYVVIWKQEKGQWKLYRDIWNTSMPPPE